MTNNILKKWLTRWTKPSTRVPARSRTRLNVERVEDRIVPVTQLQLFDPGTFASLNPETDELTVRYGPNLLVLGLDFGITATVRGSGNATTTVSLDDLLVFRSQSTKHTEFVIPRVSEQVFSRSSITDRSAVIAVFEINSAGETSNATVSSVDLVSRKLEVTHTAADPLLTDELVQFNVNASNFGYGSRGTGLFNVVTREDVLARNHLGTDEFFLVEIDFGDGSDPVVRPFDGRIDSFTSIESTTQFQENFNHRYVEAGDYSATFKVFKAQPDVVVGETVVSIVSTGEMLRIAQIDLTVREPGQGVTNQTRFVGANGILEIDRFDVSHVQLLGSAESGHAQIHLGVIDGRVRGNSPDELELVLQGRIVMDRADDAGPVLQTEPFEAIIAGIQPGAQIDGANARFSLSVDTNLRFNSALRQDLLPHVLNEELVFILRNPSGGFGSEIDRIAFNRADLEALNILGLSVVNDFDQLNRPLDIDLQLSDDIVGIGSNLLVRDSSGQVFLETTIITENVLANLDGPVGDSTIRIDYGDGSTPVTIPFTIRAANGGLVVDDTGTPFIDPFSSLDPELTFNSFTFVPTSNPRNDRFRHTYTSTGEFLVTATLTLPNGRVATEQKTVRVIDIESIPLVQSANLLPTVVHTGPGTAKLNLRGSVNNILLPADLTVTLTVDAEEFTQNISLPADSNAFDFDVVGFNVLDQLLGTATSQTIRNARLTVSGAGLFTTTVTIRDFVVQSQEIAFLDFFGEGNLSRLEFQAIGNEFVVQAPIDLDPDDQELPELRTSTFTTTNINNFIRLIGGPNSSALSKLANAGAITITSFLVDPETGGRTQIDSRSFSIPEVVNVPRVFFSQLTRNVTEGAQLPARIEIRNVFTNGNVLVDFGDGRTKELFFLSFATGSGDLGVNISASDFAYPEDPVGGEQEFELTATVIVGGAPVVSVTEFITVRDLDPIQVEFSNTTQRNLNPVDSLTLTTDFAITANNPGAGTHTVIVDWRDGTRETFENVAAESTLTLSHTYSKEFLIRQFEFLTGFLPFVNVIRQDGTSLSFNVPLRLTTPIEVTGVDHPDLAFGTLRTRGETGFEFEKPVLKGMLGQPIDLTFKLPFFELAQIANTLPVGEALTLNLRIGEERFFIRFTGVTGFGVLSPRVELLNEFSIPISDLFYDRTQVLQFRNPVTGISPLTFDRTGIFTIEISTPSNPAANSAGTFGRISVAVFPNTQLRVDENGSLQGSVTASELPFATSLLKPNSGALETLEPQPLLGEFSALVFDALLAQFAKGGEVHVLSNYNAEGVSGNFLNQPIRFSEFVLQPIIVADRNTGLPPEIRRGQRAELTITLSEPTRLLANNANTIQPFFLNVTSSDGQSFTIERDSLLEANEFRVRGTNELLQYNPTTGVITTLTFPSAQNPTGQSPFRFTTPGIFDFRVFGFGAFGNTAVIVDNIGISVTPGLEVNAAGQLVGIVNVDTPNGGVIIIEGVELPFGPGPVAVPINGIGNGFVAGGFTPVKVILADPTEVIEVEALINGNGNAPPRLENLEVEPVDDTTVNIKGRADDDNGDAVTITILNAREEVLGQTTVPAGENFSIPVPLNQVLFEFVQVRAEDGNGGRAQQDLDLNPIEKVIQVTGDEQQTVNEDEQLNPGLNFAFTDEDLARVYQTLIDTLLVGSVDLVAVVDGAIVTAPQFNFAGNAIDTQLFIESIRLIGKPNFNGTSRLNINVIDLNDPEDPTTSIEKSIDITINPVNDEPTVENVQAEENRQGVTTVTGNVGDVDGDSISVTIRDLAGNVLGEQELPPGSTTFALDVNAPAGAAALDVEINDGQGGIFRQSVNITRNRGSDSFVFDSTRDYSGNVTVLVIGGNVFLNGDNEPNGVEFLVDEFGNFVARGLGDTLLNGGFADVILAASGELPPRDLAANLSGGDDTLLLTNGSFTGTANINGGSGNDNVIIAFPTPFGGAGVAPPFIIEGTEFGGTVTIDGDAGNDVLFGSQGDDRIFGGAGEDIIVDAHGDDLLDGGPGNDTINTIPGSVDTLDDENGETELSFANAERGITLNTSIVDVEQPVDANNNGLIITSGTTITAIVGSPFDDVFTVAADGVFRTIDGNGGTDRVIIDALGGVVRQAGNTITVDNEPVAQVTNVAATEFVNATIPENLFFAGAGGTGGQVTIFDADGSSLLTLQPFSAEEAPGGVRVVLADISGDGTDDLIVGTGPGGRPLVRVLDGETGELIRSIDAFESTFTGGVFVAAGDVNGDSIADIAISADVGGGTRVRVLDGATGAVLADFYGIEDRAFRGGTRVALGDFDNDGFADLIVAAGNGGGPRIAIWDGASLREGTSPTRLVNDFFAFEVEQRGGAFVASGDVDGDGHADLIAGGGPGGGPRVTVFHGFDLTEARSTVLANFFVGDVDNRGGIHVASRDLLGDGRAEVLTGSGPGAIGRISVFSGETLAVESNILIPELTVDTFNDVLGGVFVG